jgi:hypothetical protein
VTPSLSIVGASLGSRLAKSPKKTPPSLKSPGLGSVGGVPPSGDSAWPQPEGSPQWIPQVTKSLAKDLDFIKVGFHIGRFITVAVNTEAERADIEALRGNLDSTSLRINVSISFYVLHYHLFLMLIPLLIQKIIEHSWSKDQFIRVSLKSSPKLRFLRTS